VSAAFTCPSAYYHGAADLLFPSTPDEEAMAGAAFGVKEIVAARIF